MKVVDILNKINDLRTIQKNLKSLINQHTSEKEEDVLSEACEAIDDYIYELQKKDVKE